MSSKPIAAAPTDFSTWTDVTEPKPTPEASPHEQEQLSSYHDEIDFSDDDEDDGTTNDHVEEKDLEPQPHTTTPESLKRLRSPEDDLSTASDQLRKLKLAVLVAVN